MRIKELVKRDILPDYHWINFAQTKGEDVIYDKVTNKIIWLGGEWLLGKWEDGIWVKGIFYDGIWEKGHWISGVWVTGIWVSGTWESGNWIAGIFNKSKD